MFHNWMYQYPALFPYSHSVIQDFLNEWYYWEKVGSTANYWRNCTVVPRSQRISSRGDTGYTTCSCKVECKGTFSSIAERCKRKGLFRIRVGKCWNPSARNYIYCISRPITDINPLMKVFCLNHSMFFYEWYCCCKNGDKPVCKATNCLIILGGKYFYLIHIFCNIIVLSYCDYVWTTIYFSCGTALGSTKPPM
jgi:hypothetical protein